MGNCKFANELNRLCKSSSDSIDNTEKFDDFKKYMHVTRTAEEDLKAILRNVNAGNKKTLVLLCGSAGDGKSHLLSYLKNSDEEHLIENYTIFNDATESSAPSKTAIETLNELLEPFKDNQLEIPGRNVILAINLGVLSNFVESEYGNEFSKLRSYVEDSNILTTQVNNNDFDENGHFQHVSFSDYHMYSLTKDGIHAGYIEDIMKKVFSAVDENRFYQSYIKDCESCPLSKKCPVKMNYEFLMEEKRQVYVSQLLVETIIKDKVILTTREILNFIYNIVVSQEFSFADIQKSLVDDSTYLKKFLKQITPALLFDSTLLVSVMHANNETGVIQPVKELGELLADKGILFHIDATQSCGKLVPELREIKYNMLSLSAHKLSGPQGVGALVLRKKRYKLPPVKAVTYGGQQEHGIRPGTIPVALVAGLGEACRLAETEYEQNIAAYKEKKDAVLELIEKSGIKYEINGNQDYCMPNTINLSITGVESEALMLSSKQFCGISNGSACTSHEYSPSYVLTAMGLDADRISSAIRISWGAHTDKDELINELSELIAVAKSLVF